MNPKKKKSYWKIDWATAANTSHFLMDMNYTNPMTSNSSRARGWQLMNPPSSVLMEYLRETSNIQKAIALSNGFNTTGIQVCKLCDKRGSQKHLRKEHNFLINLQEAY